MSSSQAPSVAGLGLGVNLHFASWYGGHAMAWGEEMLSSQGPRRAAAGCGLAPLHGMGTAGRGSRLLSRGQGVGPTAAVRGAACCSTDSTTTCRKCRTRARGCAVPRGMGTPHMARGCTSGTRLRVCRGLWSRVLACMGA